MKKVFSIVNFLRICIELVNVPCPLGQYILRLY